MTDDVRRFKVQCIGCHREATVTSGTIAQQMQESDMAWVMMSDGDSAWVCREKCLPRARAGFNVLAEIFGERTANLSLYQLGFHVKEKE